MWGLWKKWKEKEMTKGRVVVKRRWRNKKGGEGKEAEKEEESE